MPPVGFEPKISAGERPVAARLLRSWVQIPPGAWIFVCCECRVLSGRGLCDELITRPEESYRLCCVVVCDLETSRIGAPYIYDISRLRVNVQDDRSWADAHDRVIGTYCSVTRCRIAEERNPQQAIDSTEGLLIVFAFLKHTESSLHGTVMFREWHKEDYPK